MGLKELRENDCNNVLGQTNVEAHQYQLFSTRLHILPAKKSGKTKITNVSEMGILAGIGVLLPFPFYWWLWTNPQSWVDLCGRGRDPSTVMARVSHVLKAAQLLSLFSVASLSWPPPLYFWPLMAFGQFLNFRLTLLSPIPLTLC